MLKTTQLLEIPLARIRPNPNQPRRTITPGAIEAMGRPPFALSANRPWPRFVL